MAFCPECGKAATAEATRCVHCGHELDQPSAGKPGSRFKGTMMMAANPVAKPAPKPAAAPAEPAAPAAPAAAPPAEPNAAAPATARKPAAMKATMIGTGLGPATAKSPASGGQAALNTPATSDAQPALGGRAPAAGQAPRAPDPSGSPASGDAKRNLALAQTQLGPGIAPPVAPAAQPATVAARAAAALAQAAASPAEIAAAPHADAFGTARVPAGHDATAAPRSASAESAHLPGDPMAPQPVAARGPVLRYDDSMPELPRHNALQDKRTVWIAGAAIGFICLVLLIILVVKL